MIRLNIRQLEAFQNELFEMPEVLDASIIRVMNFMAQSVAQRARNKILEAGRSGRVYDINGRIHQASAPGEPPANLSGALANSITWRKATSTNDEATAGTNLRYGLTLEFGGFNDSNVYVEPRPFLTPSFEEAIPALRAKLREEASRL